MASSLWRGGAPLLLASTSPTRRMLLEAAGLPVETEAPGVDERAIGDVMGGIDPRQIARRLAGEKAMAVSRRNPGRLVLGADQTLEVQGDMLHKPADAEAAGRQLARLAGRRHSLHAAFALVMDQGVVSEGVESARLTMRPLDDDAVARYLDLVGAAAVRSVGAYQIEGLGIHLFERIEGDHATILGLPLLSVLAGLRAMKLLAF